MEFEDYYVVLAAIKRALDEAKNESHTVEDHLRHENFALFITEEAMKKCEKKLCA